MAAHDLRFKYHTFFPPPTPLTASSSSPSPPSPLLASSSSPLKQYVCPSKTRHSLVKEPVNLEKLCLKGFKMEVLDGVYRCEAVMKNEVFIYLYYCYDYNF